MTSQLTKVFDFRDFHLRVKVKQNPKSHEAPDKHKAGVGMMGKGKMKSPQSRLGYTQGSTRGGHRHLQKGRMLDINLISETPHAPSRQMYVSKVWESVWPEGQEAIHS